ncbi:MULTISPECIES: hypothetical protein [Burkholderia]|uniref:hypothetical protein n=1 Tax=Burkholderia TaxID=32008 RepID=UPI0011785F02|nr:MULTISPECIES: hypothetical protein [Burkholderia]EKS9793936.1 hypothetical protein [Burkholderia cepacia]EKS9803467.1 hypothetical protein [Burkholderia cepacia]EKS9811599.1 hypothetical protein [Burkholderia cepacia]EKS9819418.1 hypothetical protein [Burkholderia cepacia]EKS9826031.1 hypothetical protein [Burkholderia cepacia]
MREEALHRSNAFLKGMTSMPCEACTTMHATSDPVAHRGLVELHKPSKLRPLGRPAIVVRQYRCRLCHTNWLVESDPLQAGVTEWLCLNGSANILAPSSTPQPNDVAAGHLGEAAVENPTLPLNPAHRDGGSAIFLRATAGKA